MQLTATMTEDELGSLAHSVVPLRIDLSDGPDGALRWLDVEELLDSDLVDDEGLLLAARASIRWPERSILTQFHIERVEMLVTPRLVATPNGAGLVVALHCRALDVRWIPDFVDRMIVKRINERLAEVANETRWDFSDTLSFSFSQTAERTNIAEIGFDVSTAKLRVSGGTIEITGPMQILVDLRSPRVLEHKHRPLAALPAE